MNGRLLKPGLAAFPFATLAGSLVAHDDDERGRDRDGRFKVRANLEGFQEVPAISTVASGRFPAVIDGGISFFRCTIQGEGPVGTQTCPVGPAELTGVIAPDLVIGPSGTGIEAGALAEIVATIRNGTANSTRQAVLAPGPCPGRGRSGAYLTFLT